MTKTPGLHSWRSWSGHALPEVLEAIQLHCVGQGEKIDGAEGSWRRTERGQVIDGRRCPSIAKVTASRRPSINIDELQGHTLSTIIVIKFHSERHILFHSMQKLNQTIRVSWSTV